MVRALLLVLAVAVGVTSLPAESAAGEFKPRPDAATTEPAAAAHKANVARKTARKTARNKRTSAKPKPKATPKPVVEKRPMP